jgi:serine/threonine protein kinase
MENYIVLENIGEGSFGKVYKVRLHELLMRIFVSSLVYVYFWIGIWFNELAIDEYFLTSSASTR